MGFGEHIGAEIKADNPISFLRKAAYMDSGTAPEVQYSPRAGRMTLDDRGNKFYFFSVVLILIKQIIIVGICAKHTQCNTSRIAALTEFICVSVSVKPDGR